MKKLLIIFLFLFSINLVYSFDCNYFTDQKLKDNCLQSIGIDKDLVANLLYTDSLYPNHEFVSNYNNNLTRENYISIINKTDSILLKNVFTKILDVSPSVEYKGDLIVPNLINLRIDNYYEYLIPQSYFLSSQDLSNNGKICGNQYRLNNIYDKPKLFKNGLEIPITNQISISEDSELTLDYNVELSMKIDEYRYHKLCKHYKNNKCQEYKLICEYSQTTYQQDSVNVRDSINLTLYNESSLPNFIIEDQYEKTLNGRIYNSSKSNLLIYNNDSYYREYNYKFSGYFTELEFLKIKAIDSTHTSFRNLIKSGTIIYLSNLSECNIFSTNFFKTKEGDCEYNLISKTISDFKAKPFDMILRILLNLLLFGTGLYLTYLIGKKILKKMFPFLFLVLLLVTPNVFAQTPNQDVRECGIFDIEACFDLFFDKVYGLINAPIQGLLNYVKILMTEFPNLEVAKGKWMMMLYLVDSLIAVHMTFSGIMMMIHSYDPVKKSIAKENIFNSLVILILASSSYYLYNLAMEVSGALTATIFNFVSPDFLLIQHSSSALLNMNSIGVDLALALLFFIELMILFLLFSIRYLVLGIGLILIPLAIFSYYIPKLRGIGAIMFKIIGFYMFFPVIAAIIVLGCDTMSYADDLLTLNTIILIICFFIIGYVFYKFSEGIIKGTINFSGINNIVSTQHNHNHNYYVNPNQVKEAPKEEN